MDEFERDSRWRTTARRQTITRAVSASTPAMATSSLRMTMMMRILLLVLLLATAVPTVDSFFIPDVPTLDKATRMDSSHGRRIRLMMTLTVGSGSESGSSTARRSRMADDLGRTSSTTTTTATATAPVGKIGNWEYVHGNWVLRPPSTQEVPRAVLHFLGGALVGVSPHITYRYLLERLAEKGFLVIATPYQLSFDHLQSCDHVITKFERMAPSIARQYGALPVVGIGHSCGALLQLLITSLFPDTPRAANALLSFNNKPVSDAVPFFEEIFAPFFTTLATNNSTFGGTSNDALKLYLTMARAATEGQLPSDEALQDLQRLVAPWAPKETRMTIPSDVRETVRQLVHPSVSALSEAGVVAVLNQAVESLEQIPGLIEEVAEGARDFVPTPSATRAAARKAYRARRTLIVGYSDDPLDESDELEALLREAESITRMRRPMVDIAVQRRVLSGGHATPLWAPPLEVAIRAEDILGSETSRERLAYEQTEATVQELVRWLEEGNL